MDRVFAGRATGALVLALAGALWAIPAPARGLAQTSSTQSPASTGSSQPGKQQAHSTGKPSTGKPSSAGDQAVPDAPREPKAAANPNATPDASAGQNTSPAPSPNDQQAKPSSAAQDNPFPEDVSREAAKSAAASPSSSGVSSSSSYGPDVDRDDGDRETNAGRRRLPKPSDHVEAGSLSATARAKKDVEVGNFYLSTGEDKGAYARFADAGKMDPTNLDAIFGLAEAARHLQRTEEAIANYKLFLDIEPAGSRAKLARKALNGLDAKK